MSRIGYAPGAFDLFHIGYLNLLREARSRCDFLIAGIVADDVLIAHKGIRPVIPLSERLEIVRNIRCVDAALPATTNDKLEIWRELRFDILFKGDDWRGTEKGNRLERDLPISSGSVKQEESIPTMHLTGGPHCKERGKKVCSTANDAPRKRRFADPAKAAVMVYEAACAQWVGLVLRDGRRHHRTHAVERRSLPSRKSIRHAHYLSRLDCELPISKQGPE